MWDGSWSLFTMREILNSGTEVEFSLVHPLKAGILHYAT